MSDREIFEAAKACFEAPDMEACNTCPYCDTGCTERLCDELLVLVEGLLDEVEGVRNE